MCNCEQQTRSQRRKSSHDKFLDQFRCVSLESSNDRYLDHCAWPAYKKRAYTYINNRVIVTTLSRVSCHHLLKHKRTLRMRRSTTMTPSRLSTKLTMQPDLNSTLHLIATGIEENASGDGGRRACSQTLRPNVCISLC